MEKLIRDRFGHLKDIKNKNAKNLKSTFSKIYSEPLIHESPDIVPSSGSAESEVASEVESEVESKLESKVESKVEAEIESEIESGTPKLQTAKKL